jgi:hypothetical protein
MLVVDNICFNDYKISFIELFLIAMNDICNDSIQAANPYATVV